MNFNIKTIFRATFAMLILVSAAFFVVPSTKEMQAQSAPQGIVFFCLNRNASNQYERAYFAPGTTTNPQCPSGWDKLQAPSSDRGFCVGETPPIKIKSPNDPGVEIVDNNGTTCEHKTNLPNGDTRIDIYNFVTFATLKQYIPGGTTTTPPTTTTPGTNPGTTKPSTGGNTGTTTNPIPPTGGCETGFHKVGPLCVPNSPFNNGDAITSETTVGGLAVRIIKILLYFAGIVAVFMSIIGGYQVMTAGGNASQAVNGRKTLINAIIGLVIVILSYVIIQAVISFVSR